MQNSTSRKRLSISNQNDYSEPVSDYNWKALLSRRQGCKERFNKIKYEIEDATDKLQKIEQNSRNRTKTESEYTRGPSSLHKINNNSFITPTNGNQILNNNRDGKIISVTQSHDNARKCQTSNGYSVDSETCKNTKVPGQVVDTTPRNTLNCIPSRFASLAKTQNNAKLSKPLGSNERNYSISSSRHSISSSSIGSRYGDDISDRRSNSKYADDMSNRTSRSQSTASNSSINNSLNILKSYTIQGVEFTKNDPEYGDFTNQSPNLQNKRHFNERTKLDVETQKDNVKTSTRFAFKDTTSLSQDSNTCKKPYASSCHSKSMKSLKTVFNSCQNDIHDSIRPDPNSSSEKNNPLSEHLYSQFCENNLNTSFCPISNITTNKSVIQKHSSDIYGLTINEYLDNREKIGEDRNMKGHNYSTQVYQQKTNVKSFNMVKDSSENYLQLSLSSTFAVNPSPSSPLNNVQRNVDNCINNAEDKQRKNERKVDYLRLEYHDYSIDRVFQEESSYTSFYERSPFLQTAKVVLAESLPVTLICDTSKSIFHCENSLAIVNLDPNNNIVGVSSHQPEISDMASHLTSTQRFSKFCELSDTILHTLNLGKRKPNSSVNDNTNGEHKKNTSRKIENNEIENPNHDLSNISFNLNNVSDNETEAKENNNICRPNRSLSSTEDPGSDWEYYSESEDEFGVCNKDIKQEFYNGYGSNRPKSISFPIKSDTNLLFPFHRVLNPKNAKSSTDQWSPYLKDVTFDISPSRNPQISTSVKALNDWIKSISDPRNRDALNEMNKNHRKLYPLCTMSKHERKPNTIHTDENSNSIQTEEKEGSFVEYMNDPQTDEPTEMHIVNYCNGVRHGFYAVFTTPTSWVMTNPVGTGFTQFNYIGRFMNGKKVGMSWKWLEGNGYYIDTGEEEDDNIPHAGFYLYPNLSCGIYGMIRITL